MKKTFAILLLLLCSAGFGYSQTTENQNSLLWRIEGNGLQNPSYLFGTIHLIPKKDYIFSDRHVSALKSCKKLILEADIDIPLSKQIELARKMLLPENRTIKNYMSDSAFNLLSTYYIDSFRISKSTFNKIQKIKPILASALILNDFIDKPLAYEQELSKLAKKNKLGFDFLETIDFQMSIIEKIRIEEQIKMQYIENVSQNPLLEYNKLLEAYKSRNLNELELLMTDSDDFEQFEAALLIERNTKWLPLICEKISQESCFIAVGAAHLVGKNGLIELLKNKGYSLVPVL